MEHAVSAIIVTYQPDLMVLGAVINAVLPQVSSVIVVDNGSSENICEWVSAIQVEKIHCISVEINLGIGAAQNIGIRWVREHGEKFVLLMDQDSIADDDMVSKLLTAYYSLTKNGENMVSAIGPRFRDAIGGHLSQHVIFKRFGVGRVSCNSNEFAVPTDFLISSGSLIEMSVLDVIGDMDEGLFIDHVDTEWILRARSKKYVSWGHCNAFMTHALGEHRMRIWFLRWRDIPFHKPFRYYYVFRNSMILQKRKYPCLAWKRVDAIRLIQFVFFMSIFHPNRFRVTMLMMRGFIDGLKGVCGPLK